MAKIVLGVLVVGGALFFIFSGGNKDNLKTKDIEESEGALQEVQDEQTKEVQLKNFEERTTLAKLMENGGNHECTFAHKTEMGESTGVVYIADKKIRGDFVSKVSVPGLGDMGNIKTFMISDGESVYTWSSMSSEGYKVPASDQDKTSQSDASVPTNQELDYKCIAWQVDQSKFSLPTNITFKTL